MLRLILVLVILAIPVPTWPQDLSGSGVYDAVTINGFTLPLADMVALQRAGVLLLDPETLRFSFDPEIDTKREL